jgi:hypothetical protein
VRSGAVARVGGGVVVAFVCWRHTTKSDGTWVYWMLAADVNVRTLGGAWGARRPRGGRSFVSDVGFFMSAVLRWVHVWISKWVARGLSGGQNSKLGKLRLAVCIVWCLYGSTNLGEMGSVGKRWTVPLVRRPLCPPILSSSRGQA